MEELKSRDTENTESISEKTVN